MRLVVCSVIAMVSCGDNELPPPDAATSDASPPKGAVVARKVFSWGSHEAFDCIFPDDLRLEIAYGDDLEQPLGIVSRPDMSCSLELTPCGCGLNGSCTGTFCQPWYGSCIWFDESFTFADPFLSWAKTTGGRYPEVLSCGAEYEVY